MSSKPDFPLPDEARTLAEGVARGDRSAEDRIVRMYSGRVMAMAMVRTRDREAARELASDVLMATIQALRQGTVHETARLGAFVHGIAANLINNFLRSRKRHPRPEPLPDELPALDATDCFERDCDIALLRRNIAHLGRHDREVLTLTLAAGLEPEEIARRTGLTQEAVRQRKRRAVKRLRQALSEASRGGAPGPRT